MEVWHAPKGTADRPQVYMCTELVATLDLLLQQHHDRLLHLLHLQNGPVIKGPSVNAECVEALKKVAFAPAEDLASNDGFFEHESCSSDGTADDTSVAENVPSNEQPRRKPRASTFSQAEHSKRMASYTAPQHELPLKATLSDSARRFLCGSCQAWLRAFVSSNSFELCMSLLIVSNALFCGIEVEYSAATEQLDPPAQFYWVSFGYAVAFTAELLLKVLGEGKAFLKPPNWAWNLFDTGIVVISLLEIGLDMGSTSGQLPSIRIIRMARVVRVLRVARVMRHFRSLRILISSVLNTVRSLMWTMLLLTIILYVFGIIFTQAATQHRFEQGNTIPLLYESYGTVPRSVFSLFKAISGGVSWEEIVTPLISLNPIWVAFFLVYFAFTYFAVLNVVTGVFCQTAIESANHDQDMAAQAQMAQKQQYVQRLRNLFKQINVYNTGKITLKEFEDSLQEEQVKAYFASIDLTVDEAYSLFKLLDIGENHELDTDTFVTGCLKLRGQAKSVDIAMMMYENRWSMERILRSVKKLEGRISRTGSVRTFSDGREARLLRSDAVMHVPVI